MEKTCQNCRYGGDLIPKTIVCDACDINLCNWFQSEVSQLREENKRLRNIYQETATALLHDMPRDNCEGCQLAIREGEKLYNKMMELKGGGKCE